MLTLYTRDFTRPGLLLPSLAPNDGEESRGAALLAALKLRAAWQALKIPRLLGLPD